MEHIDLINHFPWFPRHCIVFFFLQPIPPSSPPPTYLKCLRTDQMNINHEWSITFIHHSLLSVLPKALWGKKIMSSHPWKKKKNPPVILLRPQMNSLIWFQLVSFNWSVILESFPFIKNYLSMTHFPCSFKNKECTFRHLLSVSFVCWHIQASWN